jgi:Ca2+-transporting ATPase
MHTGLTSAQAQERLKQFGYNELPTAKPKNFWRIAIEVMKEPMFILLVGCALLYMLLGDYREGAILLSTISLIITITFLQYRKTEKALEALRSLASPRALVLRDGKEVRIPGREVVPGDLMKLHEGDRIPADAEVLEAVNLTVDESMLTGESVVVRKHAEDQSMIFSGTLVVQGKGLARALQTGQQTEFGKIGQSLQNIEQEQTPLQQEMKTLIKKLFLIGALVSLAIMAAFYLTRGNLLQSILNGLAAAMAVLPEEFPVVLTIFFALGAWRMSKKNVLTRKPSAIETLGAATVLCTDKTGTITQNKMEVAAVHIGIKLFSRNDFEKNKDRLGTLLETAKNASQPEPTDPMEQAIINTQTRFSQPLKPSVLVKEYALSSTLLAMTRIIETAGNDKLTAAAKGAPEAILNLCRLPQNEIDEHLKAATSMAEKGLRVLAIANGTIAKAKLPAAQTDLELHYLGLIGLEDPIRSEVPSAIAECTAAGIEVIMITGDYPTTAKSIAAQIGLPHKQLMTGTELASLSDAQLSERIKNVNVFARVVPEQKLRIVQALKTNKHIVGMTGDGVNDAPALKAANIGIAMGNKGTDVAREAASLVLLDDNFASIVAAIRMGRRIFDNLQKAMSYIMAIHIPIIGLTLLPALHSNLPLLLLPLHIVFMELIIDPSCSIAFETEQEEEGIMQRPPRDPNVRFFGFNKIMGSLFQGFLLLALVIGVYLYTGHEGHTEPEIRAIAFSSLIIGNIILILTNLSKTRSVWHTLTEFNKTVLVIIFGAALMLWLVITLPALQTVFSFNFPGYGHFVPSLMGAAGMLAVLELVKVLRNRRFSQIKH